MNQLNRIRKKITNSLTSGVTQSPEKLKKEIKPESVQKILVSRPNHRLGNQLLITPLVKEAAEIFPNAKIDLFVKGGISPILFANNPRIDKIIALPKKHFKQLGSYLWAWISLKKKKYDLVINITPGSSSGKLSTKTARSTYKIFGDEFKELAQEFEDYRHIAQKPVFNLRKVMGIEMNREVPNLDIDLSPDELKAGRKVLEEHLDDTEKVIGIFTYATGGKKLNGGWWKNFYELLKKNFPDYSILEILPVQNVSQLDFAAPSYYSKDLREIAAVIANLDVFIGADSGMMHLASSSQVVTLGLFNNKNLKKYQPYFRKSQGVSTREIKPERLISIVKEKLEGS